MTGYTHHAGSIARSPGVRQAVIAAACFLAPLAARADTYRFDPVHTEVLFFASHLGFSHTLGRFPGVTGSFDYDPEHREDAQVHVELAVDSLYVGDDALRAKLLTDDFFDAKKYGQIRFDSTAVTAVGDDRLHIRGDLQLHGVTRQVEFDAHINRVGRHSFSLKYVAGFSATTTLRRSDFGMTHLLPAVGDEVEIRLEIEGIRQ